MAHRYWRLVGENGTGVNFYVIDFRLYSDYDSAAVNLVGSGTAICGSYSSTYTPDKAFNGSTGSYWSSANVTANSWDQAKTWVGYDFGSGNDKDIVAFAVYFNNNAPISVRLEYSDDGTTWTTQSTHVLRNRNVSLYDWQTYVSVPDDSALTGHRFWRINGIAPYTTTDYAWRTNEIEFRDSSNVVLTGYKSSAYYSDSGLFYSAYPIGNAFNGVTPGTAFALGHGYPAFVAVEFGRKVELDNIRVYST